MEHAIARRSGIGTTARIIQSQHLRFSQVTVTEPVLIIVKFGRKELRAPGFECVLGPGDAVAIDHGQMFDIVNTPGPGGQYQADWLVWDPALVAAYTPSSSKSAAIKIAQVFGGLSQQFQHSIDVAIDAVQRPGVVPDAVARHRLTEVLVWMETLGSHFEHRETETTSARIRRFIANAPDSSWKAGDVAAKLAMSEATLRRRLADENTTLGDLISDIRMSSAMYLLQSTDLPISSVALEVGYESASRFAIRFRRRFGFAPSAIRGHNRGTKRSALAATG